MEKMEYEPETYWEGRLSRRLDLDTVGSKELGYAYNHWLYKARFRAMDRAIRTMDLCLEGSSLLALGVGSGAWIPYWEGKRISRLVGVDITNSSTGRLRRIYPRYEFYRADIRSERLLLPWQEHDVVTALDVLFHIVDEKGFENAVANISMLVKEGGWVVLSDSFCKDPWGPCGHEYHRTYERYRQVLEGNGLKPVHMQPIFVTMTTILCNPNTWPNNILLRAVRWIYALVKRMAKHRVTEPMNHLTGDLLYGLDGCLCPLVRKGPSLKLLFARKASGCRSDRAEIR